MCDCQIPDYECPVCQARRLEDEEWRDFIADMEVFADQPSPSILTDQLQSILDRMTMTELASITIRALADLDKRGGLQLTQCENNVSILLERLATIAGV